MSHVLRRDGLEILRGTEAECCRWILDHTSFSIMHACLWEGYGIKTELDDWLAQNADVVREITTATQKQSGARMFVVIPPEDRKNDFQGRIVWFGPKNAKGLSHPRQFSIHYLKPDGESVRWPKGSISRAKQVSDDAGYVRYLKLQVKKWGTPTPPAYVLDYSI
jgi:hypothetical protein